MKKVRLASALLLAFLLPVACGPSRRISGPNVAATAPPSGEPAAAYQGGTITRSEVDQRAAGAVARIEQETYDARRAALDAILNERLLAQEAAARKVTVEALLKVEVTDKVQPPTSDQVAAFYTRVAPQVAGRPREEVLPQIERTLREQALLERRTAFGLELRRKAGVRIHLQAPRVDVPLPADAAGLGPANAPVTIVEFLDYECPYCRRGQTVIDQVLTRYPGTVRFVPQDFPLDGHPQAFPAARAVRCAGEQGKSWEYHQSIFTSPTGLSEPELRDRAKSLGLSQGPFATCLSSGRHDAAIRASVEAAGRLGVSSTPTFFINGRRLIGARDIGAFAELIDEELAARQ